MNMTDEMEQRIYEGGGTGKVVAIGADHAGFALKQSLVPYVRELGYEVHDKGAYELAEDDDYPDFIQPVAALVSEHPEKYIGIVIGGSGQGEAIAANKYKNVRAVVFNGQ